MRKRLRLLIALNFALLWPGASFAAEPAIFIRDVRVFDGMTMIGTRSVLVRDGKIAAVGAKLRAPRGATIVDGAGKTLLPGLIDGHGGPRHPSGSRMFSR